MPAADAAIGSVSPEPRQSLGAALAGGAFWTLCGYGISQMIRFATSMVLTRLLAPELFGIMLVVNTVRTGVELLSDIGIAQSVIRSPRGEDARFSDTAWTLQILRGVLTAILCALAAVPLALVYELPILSSLLPAAALTLVIAGFGSIGLPLLRRRLAFRRLALFEIVTAVLYSAFQIWLAYLFPTIWALIAGLIIGTLITTIGSYALIPGLRQKLRIERISFKEIFNFGKWITASSAIFFVTSNFDRIFLPTVMSIQTLGVYSIARTVVEIVGSIFTRLGNTILFPYVASRPPSEVANLRLELAPHRVRFLFVSAAGVGALAGVVDLLVSVMFDARYSAAGGMASLLMLGGWFAILAQIAESALMGLGRPQATTFSNALKLLWLALALPVAFRAGGTASAILAIAASDLVRYLATVPSQLRARFSFIGQDVLATMIVAVIFIGIALSRTFIGVPWPAWLS